MKMKKFLAALLTMSMALSVVPMTAWADEGEPVITAEAGEGTTSEVELAAVPAPLAFAADDVAAIGETGYATLQDAVAAAEEAGVKTTITLLKDITGFTTGDIVTIPVGADIVLDMDEHKIVTDSDFVGRPIQNLGTLTVTGNGTISSEASSVGYGAIRNDGNGTLIIENGTFAGNVNADGSAIRNAADCVINNGDFTGTAAVYNDTDANLTINDGYFHTTSCNYGKWAYCVNNHGNLIFNNGTVEGVQGALGIGGGTAVVYDGTFRTVACEHGENGERAHYAIYVAGETGKATATIYGGDYTAVSKSAIHVGNDNKGGDGGINAKASVTVLGGTYTSKDGVNVMTTGPSTGNPIIKGGTFSNNIVGRQDAEGTVLSAYVPEEGYFISNDKDGNYVVKELNTSTAAAKIEGSDKLYGTLEEAIAEAKVGNTVTVLNDVATTPVALPGNNILDLGRNTVTIINPKTETLPTVGIKFESGTNILKNGTVIDNRSKGNTYCGFITVYVPGCDLTTENVTIRAYQPNNDKNFNYLLREDGSSSGVGTLTLGNGTVIEDLEQTITDETYGCVGVAVLNFDKSKGNETLIVQNGAKIKTMAYAVSGNGTSHGTEITIQNGASLTSTDFTAIYHPQDGTLTINGGKIFGEVTGVEIRAGVLNVNGGEITGNGTPTETTPNGNGTTTDGAGIAVVQHTTKLPINVTINGGVISGYTALYENNLQNNSADDIARVSLNVQGGYFKAINGGKNVVFSGDCKNFISGGFFSKAPDKAFVTGEGQTVIANTGSNKAEYPFTIGTLPENTTPVQVAPPTSAAESNVTEEGPAKVVADSIVGALNTTGATAESNEIDALVLDAANKNTVTTEDQIVQDALNQANITGNVKIVASPFLDIQVTDVTIDEGDKATVALDIEAKCAKIATTAENLEDMDFEGNDQNAVIIGEPEKLHVTQPVTITIPLPKSIAEGVSEVFVQHKGYEYTATVTSEGSGENIKYFATFVNPHGFSLFTITTTSVAVAKIGTDTYTSLQDAVNAVPDNGTIEVLANGVGQSASVRGRKSFKLTGDGKDAVTITAGGGYKLYKDGDTYTVKKKSSSSDSSSYEPTYSVSKVDEIKNGKVTADLSKAAKGDKVTITVTPDKGYVIDKVTVKDADGDKLELKDKGNGEYTFTMPDSKVEIKATFVKESEKVEETVKPEEVPAAEKIVLTVSQRVANVFGEPVVNDVAPIIRNDRTMLPIRFVAQAMGATVAWNGTLQKVTITKGEDVIDIYIGSAVAFVNGNPVDLDSPAFIENSRTYLPLRFVAENLGADVYWEAETQEVTVVPKK